MENKVKLNGLTFVPYLTSDNIAKEVARVAGEIRRDMEGTSKPVFLCVLKGAFVFAADLVREIGRADAKVSFVRYASYEGTCTTGTVKQLVGLTEDLRGKDVVIIEDIVDTGYTAERMIADLRKQEPASVRFATLLYKPESSKTGFRPDYVAFSIPSKFILGYGLDLDGQGRGLSDIYVIEDEA